MQNVINHELISGLITFIFFVYYYIVYGIIIYETSLGNWVSLQFMQMSDVWLMLLIVGINYLIKF